MQDIRTNLRELIFAGNNFRGVSELLANPQKFIPQKPENMLDRENKFPSK